MRPVQYALAVVSVLFLSSAAGAFFHHKDGASYTVPLVLAFCGIVAAFLVWRFRQR
jgi:hypothetical protein